MSARHGRWPWVSLLLAALLVLGSGPASAELVAPPPPAVPGSPPADWPTAEGVAASSWILVEASTGQRLAEHQAQVRRPVASTIKLLTALTAVQRADLDERVTVGEEVLVEGASVGLAPGDTWTVEQLLEAILIRSGNDAAHALAVHVGGDTDGFVALMRQDARRLGLGEDVELYSPSGLDDRQQLTAAELATVARAALDEPRLRPLLRRRRIELPGLGEVETRNELLFSYPGATGLKTGYTLAAGNSLVASAERDGRELIAVVLDAGEDPARFRQAATLLDLGFEAFEPASLVPQLELTVAGGRVGLGAAATPVTTPVDRSPEVELPVPLRVPEDPVTARIVVDGTELGTTQLAPPPIDAGPAAVEGGAALGRSLVDGTYAALRAATRAGALG